MYGGGFCICYCGGGAPRVRAPNRVYLPETMGRSTTRLSRTLYMYSG